MLKICFLFLGLCFAIPAFAQRKLNPKIDNNETEIASFIMLDLDLAYGVQLVYRLFVIKKLKLGAGILYGANYEGIYFSHHTLGYGAVFADALQFLGHRQKWGVGGQVGHGIYNYDEVKAGVYFSISWNYRAIVSKR